MTRLLAMLAITVGLGLLGASAPALAGGDGHSKSHGSDNRSHSNKHKGDRRGDKGDRHESKGDRREGKGDRHGDKRNDDGDNEDRGGKCRGDEGNDGNDDGDNGGNCEKGRYSAWDEQWLMMAIQGDLFEIAGGNIALEKAQLQQTRDLANTLIADHTKSLEEAIDTAKDLGIEVPEDPSPTQQWQLRVLHSLPNAEFDRWYSDLEIQDHRQDIKEAQDEVKDGCNDRIQGLAADEIPVLQHHLELAVRAFEASNGQQASSSKRSYRKHLRRHLRHHAHHQKH